MAMALSLQPDKSKADSTTALSFDFLQQQDSPDRYRTDLDSPWGTLTLYSDGRSLTKLLPLPSQIETAQHTLNVDSLPVFQLARQWLGGYFQRQPVSRHHIPMAPGGTIFQRLIWKLAMTIPYGKTTTYGHMAQMTATYRSGSPAPPQAVGKALGANPLPLLIPCHRVLGANHRLVGYNAGLELKASLLKWEGITLL